MPHQVVVEGGCPLRLKGTGQLHWPGNGNARKGRSDPLAALHFAGRGQMAAFAGFDA